MPQVLLAAPTLISVDWGTTTFRAYLLGAGGAIIDRVATQDGLSSVAAGGFAQVLKDRCAAWLRAHGPLPALLSGMVGSRQGWAEAPYVASPAGLAELAARTITLDVTGFRDVRIVPGVDATDQLGLPDVMRGEECQIMGAQALLGMQHGRYLLPGTHSKWVDTRDGRIAGFRTFMTGEVYGALRNHTILGRMMAPVSGDAAFNVAAFARGLETAAGSVEPGAWLHRLFSVRTLGLMGRLAEGEAADYLSGLLIGWEMAALSTQERDPIIVVASPELSRRYLEAGRLRAVAMQLAPADCVCAGHWQIAEAAGLVERLQERTSNVEP